MSRYRKSMKDALREVRGIIKEDATTSYPPKEINKKKHDAYKDPKKGEKEIQEADPSIDDIAKGLKLDKKLVKKIMGEEVNDLQEIPSRLMTDLKKTFEPLRGKKISVDNSNKLSAIMNKFTSKADLITLFKADIPFVSLLASTRLIQKFGMSGAQINKLREEVELDEMFDYAIIDGDNKIIGLYKGSNAKKQAQMNLKGAEKQVQIKKPVKVIPVSNKKKGDTVIGIGEEVELKEFSSQQIKMAYGIANDKRYKGGNMTGAVRAIEKIAKGLSNHPDVQKVLKRTQEEVELDEMGSIKPRHYDVEVTIKNRRDAKAVDEYISDNMSMGIEDYDNDGIMTASGYTEGTVNFHGDDAGHIGVELQKRFGSKIKVVGEEVKLSEGTMKGGLITDKVDEILKIGPKFVALISRRPSVQQLERMCVQELFDDSLLDDFYYIDPSSKGIVKSGNPEAKKAYGKHASVLHRVDPRSILQYNLAGRTFQGRPDGLMLHSLGAAMLAFHLADLGIPAIKINPDLELVDNPNYKGTQKISPDVILKNFRVSKSDVLRVIQMHMRDMSGAEKSKLVSISPKSLQYQFKENSQHAGARGLVERLTGMDLTEVNADVTKSLTKKSKASGIPLGILKQVFKRGMAAFGSGSRTNMSQHGWSHARVNSFIAKKPGTWGGADKDLAKQARSSK